MSGPLAVLAYLAAINLVTFLAFAADKRAAIRGRRRISERNLLTLVAAGGSLGAVLGQTLLRHKTRKEPFRTHLHLIIGLELAALAALAVSRWR